MKLRIRGNSVRLRVAQGEAQTVGDGGGVEECTLFPGGASLRYRLEAAAVEAIDASFSDACLCVRVPRAQAAEWASGRQVALEGTVAVDGGALKILIEKDFHCLKPRDPAEDHDAFPHPRAR